MSKPLRALTLALPLLLAAVATTHALDAKDRQIDPTNRVGMIKPSSSESDLMRIYGSKAVRRLKPSESGPEKSILFEDTPDELEIEWKNGVHSPRRVIIDGGAWMTTEGVAVGLTVKALEGINGGSFDLTGANWDRPVRVVSWKGGVLSPTLQVDLVPSGAESPLPKKLNNQRVFFESSDPVLQKSDLVVKRLIIEW